MQKKLIALAVAGLVSAPVFAQSNVQIYGIMDLGFTHQSGSEESGPNHRGLKSRSGIDSSNSATSRIGFRGTEDLGNGLKAFFTIESELAPDRSSQTSSNRQAFLGLEGGFGRVWMGRDFNPSRAFWTSLDPFGATGFGNNQNVISQTSRYNNAAFYRTPSFGGLTITGAYTQHHSDRPDDAGGDELVRIKGEDDPNSKGWSITPVYKNGALTLGGAYERYSDDDIKRWNLGAGYDFGVIDVRLGYTQTKNDDTNVKNKSWLLAGVIPVSERGKILASYAHTKVDMNAGSDRKAKQFALGYLHSLSKRTAVYATYAKINTNSAADGRYGVSGGTRGVTDTNAPGEVAALTSGFAVGLRHSF